MSDEAGQQVNIRDGRRKRWWWAPNAIWDLPISGHAKALYCYLCRCADAEGLSWQKQGTIADRVGVSVSTVQRAVDELAGIKAIEVTSRAKLNLPSIYRVLSLEEVGQGDVPKIAMSVRETDQVGQADVPRSVSVTDERKGSTKDYPEKDKNPPGGPAKPGRGRGGTSVTKILDAYAAGFEKRFGERPVIKHGRNGAEAMSLNAQYGEARVIEMLGPFFASTDRFIAEMGWSFSVFAMKFNMLLTQGATSSRMGQSTRTAGNLGAAQAFLESLNAKRGSQEKNA